MVRFFVVPSMVALFLAVSGCRSPEPNPPSQGAGTFELGALTETTAYEASEEPASLEVPLAPKSDSKLSGIATFTEVPEGVRLVLDVEGLSPGKHGVHVHEKGDCSAPDAKSAGEHYAPDSHTHALPPGEPRHLGDFGNIEVGADGKGHLDLVAPHANLRENDRHSFRGRAIIVHANPDDGSQPSGNSGPRIGCGEIRRQAEAVH